MSDAIPSYSTDVYWVGGTHRVSDAGVWTPHPPVQDLGVVSAGHVLAIDQSVSYSINLEGGATNSAFDALDATVTGAVGSYSDPIPAGQSGGPGNGHGTVALVGANVNDGYIGSSGDYIAFQFPSLTVMLADVTSPSGVVIQRGVLTNDGEIEAGTSGAGSTPTSILSPDNDEVLVNDGEVSVTSQMTIDAAVTGTGEFREFGFFLDPSAYLRFESAVAVGQTVDLFNGTLSLGDPIDFRATIGNFLYVLQHEIDFAQAVTSASFVDHRLSLMDGSTLVAQLTFTDEVTAADLAVSSTSAGTQVTPTGQGTGNIAVTDTGTLPTAPPITLPPPIALLPGTGPDRTLISGAVAASIERLDGYTLDLEGSSAATEASLNASSVVFGAGFTLQVGGADPATTFGGFAAVGYNENDGVIVAKSTGGSATLAFGISDVTSPDGVTILPGAYNNVGSIAAAAGGTIDVSGSADSKLINAGNLIADGMLFVGPAVTGTGVMTVAAGGDLELHGEVSTGQAITLSAGTLTIDDPREFFAKVFDFNPLDTIVLKDVEIGSATYLNGALSLDGGADGTLHFHRPAGVTFDTNSFVLGHTATDTIITT